MVPHDVFFPAIFLVVIRNKFVVKNFMKSLLVVV